MGQLLDFYLKNNGIDQDKKEIVSCYEQLIQQSHPRNEKINILELGAGQVGASVKMWKEYYYNANVYSFDPFFLPDQEVTPDELRSFNITPIQGNQLSREDLFNAGTQIIKETGKGIDFVIDDAAHMPDAIQISIGTLFPLMNANGVYFVEDLNTALRRNMDIEAVNENLITIDPHQKMSLRHSNDIQFFDAIHHLARKGKWISNILNDSEINYLSNSIVYATIIGKQVEFKNALIRRTNDQAHKEEVVIEFDMPYVGVLRKSQLENASESIFSKEQ
tara:strand:- start:18690 stop:19520 length:831 start_codon:yes stop_codon:yes gene_type:complete